MTTRLLISPSPGPLEAFAAHFDPLFSQPSQRQAFRDYLAGLLLPAERNKTFTALANIDDASPNRAVPGTSSALLVGIGHRDNPAIMIVISGNRQYRAFTIDSVGHARQQ